MKELYFSGGPVSGIWAQIDPGTIEFLDDGLNAVIGYGFIRAKATGLGWEEFYVFDKDSGLVLTGANPALKASGKYKVRPAGWSEPNPAAFKTKAEAKLGATNTTYRKAEVTYVETFTWPTT